jgi:hypothetical protein
MCVLLLLKQKNTAIVNRLGNTRSFKTYFCSSGIAGSFKKCIISHFHQYRRGVLKTAFRKRSNLRERISQD